MSKKMGIFAAGVILALCGLVVLVIEYVRETFKELVK